MTHLTERYLSEIVPGIEDKPDENSINFQEIVLFHLKAILDRIDLTSRYNALASYPIVHYVCQIKPEDKNYSRNFSHYLS